MGWHFGEVITDQELLVLQIASSAKKAACFAITYGYNG